MNAFNKFVQLIDREAAEHGCLPEAVCLTRCDDPVLFARLRPGEDFTEYRKQREAMVAWCRARGIMVEDVPLDHTSARDAVERAKRAARSPYRLGIKFSHDRRANTAAIGWIMVNLADSRNRGGEL